MGHKSVGTGSFRSTRKLEHRILWSSKHETASVTFPRRLKTVFTTFAKKHFRAFPWRARNVTPFQLLIAEILLVQTKANDVSRVWPHLIRKYPTASALAMASTTSLVRLLQPLGLQNQKAKSLQVISRVIVSRFGGRVPETVESLLSIPHLGLYSACAVSCFVFGNRVPIVDGNVLRVLARLTGKECQRDLRRAKGAWSLAWALLPAKNCALHNYGILDFAAQICTAKDPLCAKCVLNRICSFGRQRLATLRSRADENGDTR